MTKHPIESDLKQAWAAVRNAQDVRRMYARRLPKGHSNREYDIQMARERLRRTMKPIRSFLGAAPYQTQTTVHQELTERVQAASKQLQSERRKLWKMQQRRQITT